jgi:hypothetical protein
MTTPLKFTSSAELHELEDRVDKLEIDGEVSTSRIGELVLSSSETRSLVRLATTRLGHVERELTAIGRGFKALHDDIKKLLDRSTNGHEDQTK